MLRPSVLPRGSRSQGLPPGPGGTPGSPLLLAPPCLPEPAPAQAARGAPQAQAEGGNTLSQEHEQGKDSPRAVCPASREAFTLPCPCARSCPQTQSFILMSAPGTPFLSSQLRQDRTGQDRTPAGTCFSSFVEPFAINLPALIISPGQQQDFLQTEALLILRPPSPPRTTQTFLEPP